jgi:plastocyanin
MTRLIPLIAAALFGVAAILLGSHGARAESAPSPVTHVVVIESMKFTPRVLEIRAGDRVTFKNSDLVPHTATTKAQQPLRFDSGLLKPGESWTVSPDAADPIHYACTFHPVMEGEIIVRR